MSSGGGGMGGYSGTTQQIEGQNDERLAGLLGKVKSLKDVCRLLALSLCVWAYSYNADQLGV
jgi:hypothetical protein